MSNKENKAGNSYILITNRKTSPSPTKTTISSTMQRNPRRNRSRRKKHKFLPTRKK